MWTPTNPHLPRLTHTFAGWFSRNRPASLATATNSNTNVMEDLESMGITEVFDQRSEGNLYGMSEDPNLHVDGFYHQVSQYKVTNRCSTGAHPIDDSGTDCTLKP
eukprot:5860495-Pyramimonas_sp.AAC.2